LAGWLVAPQFSALQPPPAGDCGQRGGANFYAGKQLRDLRGGGGAATRAGAAERISRAAHPAIQPSSCTTMTAEPAATNQFFVRQDGHRNLAYPARARLGLINPAQTHFHDAQVNWIGSLRPRPAWSRRAPRPHKTATVCSEKN
jgi:hypothetical protein